MLDRKVMVCSESRKKQIYTLCGQNNSAIRVWRRNWEVDVACGDLTLREKCYRGSLNEFRAIISSMLVRYSMNSLLYQELTGIVECRGFWISTPPPFPCAPLHTQKCLGWREKCVSPSVAYCTGYPESRSGVTRVWIGPPRNRGSILVKSKRHLQSVQAVFGVHPVSYSMCPGRGVLPVQSGRAAKLTTPYSAEIKN
jgi:hypothetical protein